MQPEDQILELPEDVASLSLEDANGWMVKVTEAGRRVAQAADTAEKLEALRTLASVRDELAARISELTAEAETLAADAQTLAATFAEGDDEEVVEDADEAEGDEEVANEDAGDEDAGEGDVADEDAAAHSSRSIDLSTFGAHRKPKPKPKNVETELDLGRYSREFTGLNSLKPTSGDSYATRVLDKIELFPTGFAHSFSSTASGQDNLRRFQDLQKAAKTASGGFCGPGDTIKDVVQCGTSARPVEALFQRMPIEGEFRYIRGVSLTDVLAGATSWSEAADLAVDPDDSSTWKPCVDMACSPDIDAEVYAVVFCGSFGTFQNFSNPALVADFLRKGGIAYARVAEAELLRRLYQQSIQWTYDASTVLAGQGAVSAIVDAVWTTLGDALYGGRLDLANYTLILPPGLLALLNIDNELRGFQNPDNPALALSSRLGGISVVEALDVRTGSALVPPTLPAAGGPPAALPTLRTDFDIYLIPTGDFALGQAPLVDVSVQRDSTLVRQNRAQYFVEGIESLEKLGCNPSFAIEVDNLCANGARAGLVEPRTCGLD